MQTGSILMGCYFHLKQALYRKLKKLNPNEKINSNLLKYIEHNYFEECCKYFVKTWIGCYGAKLWNIHEIDDKEMIGRTNNALERYNRRFGKIFMNAHPNLSAFVIAIRNEFEFYSEKCHQIRKNNKSIKCEKGNFSKPEIDPEYLIWKLLKKASNNYFFQIKL
ncbi:hypothetical protein HZS_7867 [Henneguya salminicola]|nr:hypothetical protein HZS_7867 [Henneguya salminicola]